METTIWGLAFCRPMINKPLPHNRDYNGDPNIEAIKTKGFIHQGSTLDPGP